MSTFEHFIWSNFQRKNVFEDLVETLCQFYEYERVFLKYRELMRSHFDVALQTDGSPP